jgi:hypothetical protein
MKNAKQVVLLGSSDAKRKGGDGDSFLAHEIDLIIEFNLPVVIANLDGDRRWIGILFLNHYWMQTTILSLFRSSQKLSNML